MRLANVRSVARRSVTPGTSHRYSSLVVKLSAKPCYQLSIMTQLKDPPAGGNPGARRQHSPQKWTSQ